MDPRDTVDRIYMEDQYILLHTKYGSFRPCGFGVEIFFFMFFPIGGLWEQMAGGHF